MFLKERLIRIEKKEIDRYNYFVIFFIIINSELILILYNETPSPQRNREYRQHRSHSR